MTTTVSIIRMQLNDAQRLTHPAKLFGVYFPLHIEPYVFDVASELSRNYHGGYWEFYALGNGGFYMAPASECPFHVVCENGFEGDLSADALGITACLYAYSHLSFSGIDGLSEACARQYHWLRDYMLEHPEVGAILRAID